MQKYMKSAKRVQLKVWYELMIISYPSLFNPATYLRNLSRKFLCLSYDKEMKIKNITNFLQITFTPNKLFIKHVQ